MRRIADGPATGAENMARDLALLQNATASFRAYSWQPHCVSLGRFQPEEDVDARAASTLGIDVVRRPTGGSAILHGQDVTFCLVGPAPPAASLEQLWCRGMSVVRRGLALLGVEVAPAPTRAGAGSAACFAGARGPDLRAGGRKVCGAALRREREAFLMHGSIFLAPDWQRSAQVLPATPAEVLQAAAVTLGELRPGTTRPEVEEALLDAASTTLN